MKSIKNTKKDIQNNIKEANATLIDFSEDIIKETVKTGEAWQKLMTKAVKNSEPLMKKQADIVFETVKGMKTEAEYSVKRFEKLTGFNFSDIRKNFDANVPTAPKWMKEGFEYITDQTEDILTEVSKRGDDIVETVTDTAKAFVKEAEGLKDKAEAKVKEVIKDVEARISDIAPKTNAASKATPTAKKTTAKRAATKKTVTATKKTAVKSTVKETAPAAKKATAKKTAPVKKAIPAKAATKKSVVSKAQVATPKATKKTATPKVTIKTTVAKTTKTTKADDLKVLEGVGPKLEQLLMAAGFTSFALVAKAEVTDLQKVLNAAGSKYKMHNPTSWPLQARFARDGKFDTLKSWQKKNNAQQA